ncbi:MAG: rRNA ((1402)-2-O)-methyltransferase [Pseudomonadota bacterium]
MKKAMGDSKRQKFPQKTDASSVSGLPSGLWIVATPIGNLSDISERARNALSHASVVLCEDTRRTRALIHALGLSARESEAGDEATRDRLRRFDRHTDLATIDVWISEILNEQKSFAVVSDAGTPGISDPGALLVQRARARGVCITPVPGPSAVTTLMSVAGWPEAEWFQFHGFLPRGHQEIQEVLLRVSRSIGESQRAGVSIWFESPERVVGALEQLDQTFSEDSAVEVFAAKELTKWHERHFVGAPALVLSQVRQEVEQEGARGEWVLAIRVPRVDSSAKIAEAPGFSESAEKALRCLSDAGVKASEAAKVLSQHFGIPRAEAYEKFLALKKNNKGGLT